MLCHRVLWWTESMYCCMRKRIGYTRTGDCMCKFVWCAFFSNRYLLVDSRFFTIHSLLFCKCKKTSHHTAFVELVSFVSMPFECHWFCMWGWRAPAPCSPAIEQMVFMYKIIYSWDADRCIDYWAWAKLLKDESGTACDRAAVQVRVREENVLRVQTHTYKHASQTYGSLVIYKIIWSILIDLLSAAQHRNQLFTFHLYSLKLK